jgi:UPF0755 protein
MAPMRSPGSEVVVRVAPGTPIRQIAGQLESVHVIPSAWAFRAWLRISGTQRSVQAGKFVFHEYDGILSAARTLQHALPDDVRVTVPEGLTIEQTAATFARALGIDSAAFVTQCSDPSLTVRAAAGASTLEGYLFPDTYMVPRDVTVREVVVRMLDRFDGEYARLTPDPAHAGSYTRRQVVTMASIVEKEAAVSEERAHIAGVFFNRLRRGETLGADPTVRYIFRKYTGALRVSELNSDSPYNTRKFRGLPPGPICSPGLASLQAAVAPTVTKDLYFVAKWDGSGEHYFAATNREFLKCKELFRANNRQQLQKEHL